MNFSKRIIIGNTPVSYSDPCFIIAEAGVNHGGDLEMAFRLIDVAAEAGVSAVKFQAFHTEELILQKVDKAPYQQQTTDAGESQYDMLRKLELRKEQFVKLRDYCQAKQLIFLVTPFDERSLEELEEIKLDAYKIASTDTTNLPFLKKIAGTAKPLILSTGMCYEHEVRSALEEIESINQEVVLLQCTANYPIQDEEANLNVMNAFREKFNVLVGFSDHTVGLGATPYAVAMGACLVEKHFTLDKSLQGPDHRASLSPGELKELVKEIRKVERFLGSSEKKPVAEELKTRASLQKCLVAKTKISKGQLIKESDLASKRTGGKGISPLEYRRVIGKTASKDFQVNDIIELS